MSNIIKENNSERKRSDKPISEFKEIWEFNGSGKASYSV